VKQLAAGECMVDEKAETDDEQLDAMRALWASVLNLALWDATSPREQNMALKPVEWQRARDEADLLLRRRGRGYARHLDMICSFLGLDGEVVAEAYIAGKIRWQDTANGRRRGKPREKSLAKWRRRSG